MTPSKIKDLNKPARFEKLKRHLAKNGMPSALHSETTQKQVLSLEPGTVKLPKKKGY